VLLNPAVSASAKPNYEGSILVVGYLIAALRGRKREFLTSDHTGTIRAVLTKVQTCKKAKLEKLESDVTSITSKLHFNLKRTILRGKESGTSLSGCLNGALLLRKPFEQSLINKVKYYANHRAASENVMKQIHIDGVLMCQCDTLSQRFWSIIGNQFLHVAVDRVSPVKILLW
jgi:hypothetical protein